MNKLEIQRKDKPPLIFNRDNIQYIEHENFDFDNLPNSVEETRDGYWRYMPRDDYRYYNLTIHTALREHEYIVCHWWGPSSWIGIELILTGEYRMHHNPASLELVEGIEDLRIFSAKEDPYYYFKGGKVCEYGEYLDYCHRYNKSTLFDDIGNCEIYKRSNGFYGRKPVREDLKQTESKLSKTINKAKTKLRW